jgi:membrane fusion protein, multidrug efflux system
MKKLYRRLLIATVSAAIVILAFTLSKSMNILPGSSKEPGNSKKQRQQLKVDAFVVKPSLLIDEISVSGSLLAFEEVELKNEVAGRVVKINLPEGQYVNKGTLLVKLFDDDLQANLNKLYAQLAIQEQIYKRQTELLDVSGISQNDYEQTGLLVNSIKAEIEVQKVLIRKTEVLAPFDGVIGLRNISMGAQITPSTLLATIRSENNLKLDFSVPEKYSLEIRPGMKINFTLSNQVKQYEATVMATEEGIDPMTRNLKVRAIVNNQSDHLLPGTYTDVNLRLNEHKNALMVPTQAIIPQEENKSVIIAKEGVAHFVSVTTGTRRSSDIEITNGLNPGDTIITTGILFIREGTRLAYSTIKADSI